MDYRELYKSMQRANRNRPADNVQLLKIKRGSSRHERHQSNRRLSSGSEQENENNGPPMVVQQKSVQKTHPEMTKNAADKENGIVNKYQERLERLQRYKQQKEAVKTKNAKKTKPFISAVPKSYVPDLAYEKNLYRKAEPMQRPPLRCITPAGKVALPRVDSFRKELPTRTQEKKKLIVTVKTPATLKNAKPKVDCRRQDALSTNNKKRENPASNLTKKPKLASATSTKLKQLQVPSAHKSKASSFKFNNDGSLITSTNRKRKPPTIKMPPTEQLVPAADNEFFDGISPIDVNIPTPEKQPMITVASPTMIIKTRGKRRRSLALTKTQTQECIDTNWQPQVVTITVDDSELKAEEMHKPRLNESFTIEPQVVTTTVDDSELKTDEMHTSRLNESFTIEKGESNNEEANRPTVDDHLPRITVCDSTGNSTGRVSIVVIEDSADPVINESDEVAPTDDTSCKEELPQEELPPQHVREKCQYYYELVERELERLQKLCNLYSPFIDVDELDENCKGLIIAAQGQTNILVHKKLTKFKSLVGHYETSWSDQKVRDDDLDGFWFTVSLDLENLDKRFNELRQLKENNWQEQVVAVQPKTKKLKDGGGIKKRERKPVAAKASGIAAVIKQAREEAKKKKMLESALAETVTLVTSPRKRMIRIKTPQRESTSGKRRSTPQSGSEKKRSRKTIFHDHSTRKSDMIKSILKTPREKRRAKSVLFIDAGLDTPEQHRRHSNRRIVDTPKPKIKFNEEPEVEDIVTLERRTPGRLQNEIRKRRQYSQQERNEQDGGAESSPAAKIPGTPSRNRRSSMRHLASLSYSSRKRRESTDSDASGCMPRTRSRGKVTFQ